VLTDGGVRPKQGQFVQHVIPQKLADLPVRELGKTPLEHSGDPERAHHVWALIHLSGLVQAKLLLQEWVLNLEALESLAMLEVLTVEDVALTFHRRGQDQGVIPRKRYRSLTVRPLRRVPGKSGLPSAGERRWLGIARFPLGSSVRRRAGGQR
jgi:hypothetical protein